MYLKEKNVNIKNIKAFTSPKINEFTNATCFECKKVNSPAAFEIHENLFNILERIKQVLLDKKSLSGIN